MPEGKCGHGGDPHTCDVCKQERYAADQGAEQRGKYLHETREHDGYRAKPSGNDANGG